MKDNWVYLPAVLKLPSVAVRFELPLSQQLISHSFLKRLLSSQQLLDSSQRQTSVPFSGLPTDKCFVIHLHHTLQERLKPPSCSGGLWFKSRKHTENTGKNIFVCFFPMSRPLLGRKMNAKEKKRGKV